VQKRAQYEKELGDLPAERAAGQDEQRLSAQIAGLGKQLEYKAVDLKATEEKLAKTAAELQTLAQVLGTQHMLFTTGRFGSGPFHQLQLTRLAFHVSSTPVCRYAMIWHVVRAVGMSAGATAASTWAGQGGEGGQGTGCPDQCSAGVPHMGLLPHCNRHTLCHVSKSMLSIPSCAVLEH